MGKVRMALLLVLALFVPLLAACGGGGGGGAAATEAPAATSAATSAVGAGETATGDAGVATSDTTEATSDVASGRETGTSTSGPAPTSEEATSGVVSAEGTNEATADAAATSVSGTATAGAAGASDLRVGLVTDIGRVNDGTFNQFAYEGLQRAQEELGVETNFIETQAQTDYANNLQTFIDEEYNVIVTVGFLIADATYAAAQANPDILFIGVDQGYFEQEPLPNLVGIQFREDQAGFLAGAMAGMLTESNTVGIVAGIDIPPVKRFGNGFQHGVNYVNPDANVLVTYVPSFTDPAQGASVAQQFIGEGADVIFGAGGPTGSGAIKAAAENGAFVIGVDQDEYNTTFGGGSTPGADRIVTSALKRVDVGVFDMIQAAAEDNFPGGTLYTLDVANGGIGYAEPHDAADAIPAEVTARMEEILAQLGDNSLTTGVDLATGDVDEATIPEPVPFER
jgi:basic membrane protein A and related proteins